MDWLENLLPFLLFALYFLAQLRKSTQKKQAKPLPLEGPASESTHSDGPPLERARTPFEELLHQIQAAAEATQHPDPPKAAEPVAPPPPRLPVTPRRIVPKPVPQAREFKPIGGYEHDKHGFGPDSPFSEEAFEKMPRGLDITEHAHGSLRTGSPAVNARPGRRSRAEFDAAHPMVAKLRSAGSVKEAFALKEILDEPRSRRRSIR